MERWSSAALAVVASLSFAGSCGERETTTERSSPTPTRSPESSPPRLVIDHATFMPVVKPEGETVELAVTFPDGSSATLRYPEALGLDRMGAQPDVAYVWTRDPPPRFPLLFFHGSPPASGISTGTGPVGTYVSPQGERLELWRGTIGESEAQYWLVYRLPSWTVVASVKDVAAAEEVAAALHVAEGDSGFVVASARGPIRLADGFGEGQGPQLAFGDAGPEPQLVQVNDTFDLVLLSPEGCSPSQREVSAEYAALCLGEGSVFASVYGSRDFVSGVADGLVVEDFTQAT